MCVSFHRAQQLKDLLYVFHLFYSETLLKSSHMADQVNVLMY